jgi:flagellar FliL protein
MAAPDEKKGKAAGEKQQGDGNPVIENKKGKTSKKSMKKLWIVIVLLVLVTAVGVTLGLSYFKGVQLVFENKDTIEDQKDQEPGEEAGPEEPRAVVATLALEPFLVNLADRDSVRFVKTSFRLGLGKELEEKKIEMKIPAIRDSIITLLSSKTAEQIMTPQGKDKLRQQVRTRVNSISDQIDVLEVYIVDFVVQL